MKDKKQRKRNSKRLQPEKDGMTKENKTFLGRDKERVRKETEQSKPPRRRGKREIKETCCYT